MTLEEARKEHYAFLAEEDWEEPEPLWDCLFLDEEREEIESECRCKMSELPEIDLMNIVSEVEGRKALSATWDEEIGGIRYSYEDEEEKW